MCELHTHSLVGKPYEIITGSLKVTMKKNSNIFCTLQFTTHDKELEKPTSVTGTKPNYFSQTTRSDM